MKGFILLAVVTLAYAKSIDQDQSPLVSARGYIQRAVIPLGEEIRKAEEAYFAQDVQGRIAGGSPSHHEQFPYQAGVLTRYKGLDGTGVCGASLVSANRLIHAAHCWFDGLDQGYLSTIVLGSITIFSGGVRIDTSNIVVHPGWNPNTVANDVSVIILPTSVSFSSAISPVALPTGNQLNEDFAGDVAVASGFGRTGDGISDGISLNQFLSYVLLYVIPNSECRRSFPANVLDSNICTSGAGGISTCRGDSGGPLTVTRDNRPLLVGITSFGSIFGCTRGFPAAFARVSSFMDFFNQYL